HVLVQVPPEGRALAKAQGDYHAQIGQAQRHLHENVARPPRPELQDRWRAELRPAQVALYERLAGAELRRHGYPLLGAGGAAPLAVAAEAAASWGEFALHRVRNTLRAFLVTGGSGEKLRRRWSRWTRGRGAGG
ncbi:MAG TPA: hypothetical protein VHG08_10875, partial [Longimicrobium sp.]|nr:hypothetical protein [Longimicrobium sp.]